jgi:hypothetical protein
MARAHRREGVKALDSQTGNGRPPSPATPLRAYNGQEPLRPYGRRARRRRSLRRYELGRYELGRYELGRWAVQWLLERGPSGVDL